LNTATSTYHLASSIPELAFEREVAQERARATMHARERQMLYEDKPMQPVDALSSGHRVLAAESPELRKELYGGLVFDCKRLFGEWRSTNIAEYFEPIEHEWDEATEAFFLNGRSTSAATESGLIPTVHHEENEYRINDYVEEETMRLIRGFGGAALAGTVLRTHQPCADWAIDVYKNGGKNFGGYVPWIEKRIFRDMKIDPKTGNRSQEQVNLPADYLTDDIIEIALLERNIDTTNMTKNEKHAAGILADDSLMDFVAHLDQVASREWCAEIFMGEVVNDGTVKDYEVFKQQAIERQRELDVHAEMTADFILDLCRDNTDGMKALELVENFVKHILIAKSQHQPEIAVEIFDEKTAIGLQEVDMLLRLNTEASLREAEIRLTQVIQQAPGGGYCGAGSCDLVRARLTGDEADKIKKLGFDPKDTLVDKSDRTCKKCGSKTVVYDLKQAKKGCIKDNCGATKGY